MSIRRNQRGDTLVEVLICVAVLSLILTAAFILSNRNSIAARRAQERVIALKVAETQLELLKSYIEQSPLPPTTDDNFCLNSPGAPPTNINIVNLGGAAAPDPNPDADATKTYNGCVKDGLYRVAFWSPNISGNVGAASVAPSPKPYAITVRWEAAGGRGREESKTFYSIL